MEIIKLGEWKNKTLKGRYKKSGMYYREKIKYRDRALKNNYFLEEGIITDYETREPQTMKWEKTQKHLIGYHYISVIDKVNPEADLFWIQNMGSEWGFFYNKPATGKTRYFKTFKKALEHFNTYLKKEFNCILECDQL